MVFTNPIRVGGLPMFKEGSPLRSRRDSDSVGLQWRKGDEYGRSAISDRENMRLLMWKLNRLRLYKGTGAEEGLRLADPLEYDPEKDYDKFELVRVSPTNPANLDGISNRIPLATGGAIVGVDGFGANHDKATAVLFAICVKPPKVLHETQPSNPDAPRNYKVHVPVWPEPGGDPEFPQDPLFPTGADSPDNYWLIDSLYPVTLGVCVNGKNKSYYVQAQPVPDKVLIDEGSAPMSGEGGEGMTSESP